LTVSPISDPVRAFQIAWKRILYRFYDVRTIFAIAFCPSSEMIDMRHSIALLCIASAIGEYKVMTQIDRVLGPRDEMVDMAAIRPDWLRTIEAISTLQFDQDRPYLPKRIPFGSEKELSQIEGLAEELSV